MWVGHLQLEVCVVGDGHELNVTCPLKNGVVGHREVDHLELQSLSVKIGEVTECDGQSDPPERVGLVA